MNKLKFIMTGGPFGDCTSNYNVEFPNGMTVGEFIEAVCRERANEWGDISHNGGSMYNKRNCTVYKHGVVTNDYMVPEEKNLKVISAKANGGWSLMSYDLKVE